MCGVQVIMAAVLAAIICAWSNSNFVSGAQARHALQHADFVLEMPGIV